MQIANQRLLPSGFVQVIIVESHKISVLTYVIVRSFKLLRSISSILIIEFQVAIRNDKVKKGISDVIADPSYLFKG